MGKINLLKLLKMFGIFSKASNDSSNSMNDSCSRQSIETDNSKQSQKTDESTVKAIDSYSNLTDDKKELLSEFCKMVSDEGLSKSKYDEWFLLRFCIEKQWDLTKAFTMFESYLVDMEEHNVEKILEFDHSNAIIKHEEFFNENFVGIDKYGRPIKIQKYHYFEKDNLFKMTHDQFKKYNYRSSEALLHVVFPYCSKLAKTRVDQVVVVIDFADTNYKAILSDKNVRKYIQVCTEVGESYPEILGKMYIVNVPFIFHAAWKLIKMFLPQAIIDKIQIMGKKYQEELADELGKENLPEFAGGFCEDWKTKRMPWSDYLDYCREKQTYYHNDLPKVSDPVIYAENNIFDVQKLRELDALKKAYEDEVIESKEKISCDDNLPENDEKNQNLEDAEDEFYSNEYFSDDQDSFVSAKDEKEIIQTRSMKLIEERMQHLNQEATLLKETVKGE